MQLIVSCAGNLEDSKIYLNKFIGLAHIVTPIEWLSCGGDEFLVGRAGYLEGVLWLRAKLGEKVCLEGEDHRIKEFSGHFIQYKATNSNFPGVFNFSKSVRLHNLSVSIHHGTCHQYINKIKCIRLSSHQCIKKSNIKNLFEGSIIGSDGCVTCALDLKVVVRCAVLVYLQDLFRGRTSNYNFNSECL